jgi:hypothetical protein
VGSTAQIWVSVEPVWGPANNARQRRIGAAVLGAGQPAPPRHRRPLHFEILVIVGELEMLPNRSLRLLVSGGPALPFGDGVTSSV